MICTGEPFVVFVQLVGKVLVSRLYLSPPYSITILLEKTEFVLGMYGGPLVLLPFIRYFYYFFFRDYQLKLKANTHYEKQEHNSLQQNYF